jgi:hypothetical protein
MLRDLAASGRMMTEEESTALRTFLEGDPHELLAAIEKQPKGVLAAAVRAGLSRTAAGAAASGQVDQPPPQLHRDQPSVTPPSDPLFSPVDTAPAAPAQPVGDPLLAPVAP